MKWLYISEVKNLPKCNHLWILWTELVRMKFETLAIWLLNPFSFGKLTLSSSLKYLNLCKKCKFFNLVTQIINFLIINVKKETFVFVYCFFSQGISRHFILAQLCLSLSLSTLINNYQICIIIWMWLRNNCDEL